MYDKKQKKKKKKKKKERDKPKVFRMSIAIDDGVAFSVESEDGLIVLDWFEQRNPNGTLSR